MEMVIFVKCQDFAKMLYFKIFYKNILFSISTSWR